MPAATTTIGGKELPPPDASFGGVIKDKASESTAWGPPRVVPPNVLLRIMNDDHGYGAPSTFAGVIPTPAKDRIAKAGLRYANFHSTSLCSPTVVVQVIVAAFLILALARDKGTKAGSTPPQLRRLSPPAHGLFAGWHGLGDSACAPASCVRSADICQDGRWCWPREKG